MQVARLECPYSTAARRWPVRYDQDGELLTERGVHRCRHTIPSDGANDDRRVGASEWHHADHSRLELLCIGWGIAGIALLA